MLQTFSMVGPSEVAGTANTAPPSDPSKAIVLGLGVAALAALFAVAFVRRKKRKGSR